MKKIFVKKKVPQARFFCEKTAPQAKNMKENVKRKDFFD